MTNSIGILLFSLIKFRPASIQAFSSASLTSRSFATTASSPNFSPRTATSLLDMNPLQSLFQNIQKRDMTTSLSSQQVSQLASGISAPSWEEIRTKLSEKQTPEEREFRNNLPKGIGVGSPLHKLRLFDESNREEDVRVTLFRDSASWCPYCQKVSAQVYQIFVVTLSGGIECHPTDLAFSYKQIYNTSQTCFVPLLINLSK